MGRTEHLGIYAGHGKSIGAICNSSDFSGVVEVEPGVLGPRNGWVAVDPEAIVLHTRSMEGAISSLGAASQGFQYLGVTHPPQLVKSG
jgi:hypothetical protein